MEKAFRLNEPPFPAFTSSLTLFPDLPLSRPSFPWHFTIATRNCIPYTLPYATLWLFLVPSPKSFPFFLFNFLFRFPLPFSLSLSFLVDFPFVGKLK